MTTHPFAIRRNGNLFDGVSDAAVLFTQVSESEARATLSRYLAPEHVDGLFINFDNAEFARRLFALRNNTRNAN